MKGLTAAHKLLQEAAMPTFDRISDDWRKAPPQVRPLLDYLREHLFEPDLDANRLKRACGIRDNAVPIHFHTALKLPPYAYIEDCRLQTGSQLLLGTNLRIWQIAQLLGYSNLQVFSRAFQRWAGVRPTAFRRRARVRRRDGNRPVIPSWKRADRTSAAGNGNGNGNGAPHGHDEGQGVQIEILRRAVHGGLDKSEADDLLLRLAGLYPDSFRKTAMSGAAREPGCRRACEPDVPEVSLDRLREIEAVEQMKAEEAWNELRDRPFEEQRQLVRDRIRFKTPALFELLQKKYLEEGRSDRKVGVQLANLALDSVDSIELSKSNCASLRARAWANLSNALRLQDDNQGAEEAICNAEKVLPRDPELRTEAEIYHLRAALRWSQRRIPEALEDQDRAVHLFRALGENHWLARGLIMKGFLFQAYGQSDNGIPALVEAIDLAQVSGDTYLHLSASQTLAWCYTDTADFKAAAEVMPEIQRLCSEVDHRFVWVHYHWQDGYVAQGLEQLERAERCFEEAREGFLEIGKMSNAGLVSLDLCLLFALQGKTAEVLALATSVIPLFDALRYHDEAIVAIQLLEKAVAAENVTRSTLREVRDTMEQLRKDPTVKFL